MPISYPVSCSPQAWAAGTIPYLLQVVLGIEADVLQRHLRLRPHLPEWLHDVQLRGLRFGGHTLDVTVVGHGVDVEVSVETGGDVEVTVNGLAARRR